MKYSVGDIVEVNEDVDYAVTKAGTRWVVYGYWTLPGSNALLLKIGLVPGTYEEFESIKDLMVDNSSRAFLERTERRQRRYNILESEVEMVGKMGTNKDFKDLLSQGDVWEQEIEPRRRGQRVSSVATSFMMEADDSDLPF